MAVSIVDPTPQRVTGYNRMGQPNCLLFQELFHRHAGFLFSIGGKDLEMMNTGCQRVIASPHDFILRGDFDHRYSRIRSM